MPQDINAQYLMASLTFFTFDAFLCHMAERTTLRLPPELEKRFSKMKEATGITKKAVLENAVESICKFYEEHGFITMPFALIPQSQIDELKRKVYPQRTGEDLIKHLLNPQDGKKE